MTRELSERGLATLLHERGIVDQTTRARLQAQHSLPAWLTLLQALAAWLTALLVLGALLFPMLGMGVWARGFLGVLLCATAIALFRRPQPFTEQLGLAFSVAGQLLLGWRDGLVWLNGTGEPALALSALIAGLMFLLPASRLHRIVCALLAAQAASLYVGFGVGAEILAVLLLALVVLACLGRARLAAQRAGWLAGAIAPGFGLAVLAIPAALTLGRDQAWHGVESVFELVVLLPWLAAGAALLLLGQLRWLLRKAGPGSRWRVLALTLFCLVLLAPIPGFIVAVSVLIAAVYGAQRGLAAAALVALPLYLGEFYYRLDLSLLAKSWLLLGSGLLLLALRAALQRMMDGVQE